MRRLGETAVDPSKPVPPCRPPALPPAWISGRRESRCPCARKPRTRFHRDSSSREIFHRRGSSSATRRIPSGRSAPCRRRWSRSYRPNATCRSGRMDLRRSSARWGWGRTDTPTAASAWPDRRPRPNSPTWDRPTRHPRTKGWHPSIGAAGCTESPRRFGPTAATTQLGRSGRPIRTTESRRWPRR